MLDWIAARVRKTKKGKPRGCHPTGASIKELLEDKMDEDDDWFPGKHSGVKRGPARILVGAKRNAIVSAVQNKKRKNEVIAYSTMVAACCPEAMKNPATGEPVDKKLLFTVFREFCHDPNDPDDLYDHRPRLSREALDDGEIKPPDNFVFPFSESLKLMSHMWVAICMMHRTGAPMFGRCDKGLRRRGGVRGRWVRDSASILAPYCNNVRRRHTAAAPRGHGLGTGLGRCVVTSTVVGLQCVRQPR